MAAVEANSYVKCSHFIRIANVLNDAVEIFVVSRQFVINSAFIFTCIAASISYVASRFIESTAKSCPLNEESRTWENKKKYSHFNCR